MATKKKKSTSKATPKAKKPAQKKKPASKKKPAAKKKPVAKKKPATKKKSSENKTITKSRGTDQKKQDENTVKTIEGTAQRIHAKIKKLTAPELKMPVRSLRNVSYDKRKGFFEIGKNMKTRSLSVNTVKTFAQTLKMMSLSRELVLGNDFATKRDAYYQSKNWGQARFKDQPESDTVMDDMEAMFSIDGVTREQLRFVPDQHGGAVAGALKVIDRDIETGERIEIDCTRFGSGAYSVPSWVEHLEFKTKAKFIMCIETQGMFQRLQSHKYWAKANCILVSMGGVPTRACRRFVRRLSESAKIPVYAFTDCDPYGIGNIYRTLKVGSGNAAHINQFFCVPGATYMGLMPQDIQDFGLENATHPLGDQDIKRAKDALKNDPFFQAYAPWRKAIQMMIKTGVRAEQQALSLHGLNFVMEEYLPVKLKNTKKFLP